MRTIRYGYEMQTATSLWKIQCRYNPNSNSLAYALRSVLALCGREDSSTQSPTLIVSLVLSKLDYSTVSDLVCALNFVHTRCSEACCRTATSVNRLLLIHQSCDQTCDNYWWVSIRVNRVNNRLGVAGGFTSRAIFLAFGDFGHYVCISTA